MKGEVQVYRNLHKTKKTKNGAVAVYSVKNSKGLVEDHSSFIVLEGCKFRVSEKGNSRVREEKRKNVHAVVQGKRLSDLNVRPSLLDKSIEVTYNPYKNKTFVNKKTNEPIFTAQLVLFIGSKVYAVI